MVRRWLGFWVCMLLAIATPAGAADTSEQASRVAYQRDRLAVHDVGSRWYVVTDGHGRSLTAMQLARALGDSRTYTAANQASRLHGSVGGVATAGGPIAMLIGLNRVSTGQLRQSEVMVGAGYGTLVVGMAATAGGIALLADRRVRRPPSYYDRDQARRLVAAYNRRLLDAYGLTGTEASLIPRAPRRVRARLQVGLTGVLVQGAF
ncbi:MAG: hypothetical protein AB8H79_24435 [Myxococcota bacterium]